MSAEANVYAALSGLTTVYPGVCTAEPPPSSYAVYQRIASVPELTLAGGTPGMTWVRMQIDAYARSYPAVKALADSLRAAMQAAGFTNHQDNEMDLYEQEVKYFRVTMDFMVWQ